MAHDYTAKSVDAYLAMGQVCDSLCGPYLVFISVIIPLLRSNCWYYPLQG